MSDLKTKLAAAAAEKSQLLADQEAAAERYKQTVVAEYPRLLWELHEMVKTAVGGVDGVRIDTQEVAERLGYQSGSPATGVDDVTVGVAKVPQWRVSFFEKHVTFRPGGVGFFGVNGKIEVQTSRRPNPFAKDAIFMLNDKDAPGRWVLAVADERNRFTRLTDAVLQDLLEQVLL